MEDENLPKKKLMKPLTSLIGDDEIKSIIETHYKDQGYKTCEMETVVDINSAEFGYKFKICGGNTFYCECAQREQKNRDAVSDTVKGLEAQSPLSPDISTDTFTASDLFED